MTISGIQLLVEINGCPPEILNDETIVRETLLKGMQACGFSVVETFSHKFDPIGVTVVSIIQESHVSVHTFPEAQHVSIDIFHCIDDPAPLYTLLDFLKKELRAKSMRVLEVSRVNRLSVNNTADITPNPATSFEVDYYAARTLVDASSEYQHIRVIENDTFGRMLFLNNDLQVAEKDVHLYNRAMVEPVVSNGKLDSVLILGGGDGGVLNELLTHDPGNVTLVDIDERVVSIAREYLPTICGTAFDDERVNVVFDDAVSFVNNHQHYDAVIYDLTMDPEGPSRLDRKTFLSRVFSSIHRCLNPGGILSMQVCSGYEPEIFEMIRDILTGYFDSFEHESVHIPSFCEPWIFARATKR